ncbi:unnamed protein product [Moneuplotes crassus]|uniref:F-box domain-containing protein n=1 Tax=Euplotes crassus TaxID=5936 RepID=A0AAD1Y2R8_EUPCR|nr:unnamed protein product [Moneuplotes crassus]
MKLLNIIIREILLYLEFKDIQKARLHLINKQFYHNIIEDNEFLRRALLNKVSLCLDYNQEEQYQKEILERLGNSFPEENKCDGSMPVRIYENIESSPIHILLKLQKSPRRVFCICQRTTGGQQYSLRNAFYTFCDVQPFNQYNSCPELYFPNGVCCITGLLWHEDSKDLQEWEDTLNCIENSIEDSPKKIKPKKSKKSGPLTFSSDDDYCGRDQCDDRDDQITRISKIKENLENKVIKQIVGKSGKFYSHTKGSAPSNDSRKDREDYGIYEYDTSCFDDLSRINLFVLTKVHVSMISGCSCPIKAFALLIHDSPMYCEDHPLALLLKKVYELSGWKFNAPILEPKRKKRSVCGFSRRMAQKIRSSLSSSSSESSSSDEIGSALLSVINKKNLEESKDDTKKNVAPKTDEKFKEFIKLFATLSKAGLIPEMANSVDRWMEFDQKFYSKRLSDKYINEEEKFDLTKTGLKKLDIEKISQLYLDLNTEVDYYRLRLAAIGYDLSTKKEVYDYAFKHLIAGRFVTILSLDIHEMDDPRPNVDVGGILFEGHKIPGILKFSS